MNIKLGMSGINPNVNGIYYEIESYNRAMKTYLAQEVHPVAFNLSTRLPKNILQAGIDILDIVAEAVDIDLEQRTVVIHLHDNPVCEKVAETPDNFQINTIMIGKFPEGSKEFEITNVLALDIAEKKQNDEGVI